MARSATLPNPRSMLTGRLACCSLTPSYSGHVILWDDGTIGNLPRLAKLRSISGQFILYGAPIAVVKASEGGKPGGKYLVNLQGLESLEVRGIFMAWGAREGVVAPR